MATKQPCSPAAFRCGASRGYGAGMPQFKSPLALVGKGDAHAASAKLSTPLGPLLPSRGRASGLGFSPSIRFRNPAVSLKSSLSLLKQSSPASSTRSTPNSERPVTGNDATAANLQQQDEMCRCQRPPTLIMCTSCGFTFSGRVRTPCFVHPTQIYLMDNESCPQCCSTSLREYNRI